MTHVELLIFRTGSLRCKYHHIYLNEGLGEDFEIPVPWYLVIHPRGNVVIDGGIPLEAAADAHRHWGPVAEVFRPVLDPSETCLAQVRASGIEATSVKTVLLSHLHLDHTGAIGRFPGAVHMVQRAEFEYALAPDWFCAGGFIRADFDRPDLRWSLLEGPWGDFHDLYGDGAITCIRTPGHTVGHQSFLIRTSRGPVLLAVDAADTLDHWNEKALPGAVASAVDAVRSVRKLHRVAAQSGATIITGHDPAQWREIRMAPDVY